MRIMRNLLYANRATYCGKVYSLMCLADLANEINKSPSSKKIGYVFDPDENFWHQGRPLSHKILYAEVADDALVAEIETLDTKSGVYLENHLKEFIFRPYATFFETDAHFFTIQNFYAITAMKADYDMFNSMHVFWTEHLSAETTRKRLID